ncbi:polycystin-2-like protein 1 isoform X2 [Euwallacea fornicatus]|uniref:polycystin-2-like protein 1 isoform X2 n=1 Tax=Euwallacea fornicatus TaxID=995702 RepID=UPI0033906A25
MEKITDYETFKTPTSATDIDQKTSNRSKTKKPLWVTASIAEGLGREEFLAATLVEIIFHLISLFFLTIYIFSKTDSSEYYLTESFKKAFEVEEGLAEVVNVDKYWEYINGNVLTQIYGGHEAGGLTKEKSELASKAKIEESISSKDDCSCVATTCFRVVRKTERASDWGNPRRNNGKCAQMLCQSFHVSRWIFSDSSVTKSLGYRGTLTSYSGGGFYADFSPDLNTTMNILNTLRDNLWITRGTRAAFIDFSVYNANMNLYCICKLIFEFLPTGGVTPSYNFSTANLTPLSTTWQWTLRILFYAFCVYALFCSAEEIREIIYFKGRYFLRVWNYIDITVILLTCQIAVSTEYMRTVIVPDIKKTLNHPTHYGNLENAKVVNQVVKISEATLLFFVYLRTFKYLNFNRRMSQLNNTIRRCAKDILGFSVMFFVAYFAYAELGYLVFGNQVEDFRSFGRSMFTLLRTILGDFDYETIQKANSVVAPIYFLTYIMLVFFILINMFLAIINDTYADVKVDIAIASKEIEMTEYIADRYRSFLRKLGCKVRKEHEKQTIINTNIAQIRDALVKLDFDDREIEMYFTRYDINPLAVLKREDIERFFDKFAQEELDRKRVESHVVTWKDFQKQNDKLVELENTLLMVGQKVHELLRTIETMQDKAKLKAL